MLRGLLKREEQEAMPVKPVPLSVTPVVDSPLRPLSGRSNCDSLRGPSTPSRKRRRKPVRVEALFLEPDPEPLVHARALIQLIQTECPEKIGGYIPRAHLESAYKQMCAQNDWKPRHWSAIGRRLNRLTDRRRLKRNGRQFCAYRIPRACS